MDSGDRPSAADADDGDGDGDDATMEEPGHDEPEEPSNDVIEEQSYDGTEDLGDDITEDVGDSDPVVEDEQQTAADDATSAANGAMPATEDATAASGDAASTTSEPSAAARAPDPEPGTAAADETRKGPVRRFLTAKRGPLMWIREMLSSAAVVLAIGLVLFAVSGVWPPMVAVESGSMEPNMEKGDLIFVTEPGRFAPDAATNQAGVVTYQQGQEADYSTFGNPGSVVVYQQPGRVGSPIIHRARFHVEAGENWYDRANKDHIRADDCQELTNCPAPHAGFITKGDANGQYDQANGIAPPVKAEWVTGVARVRIPYLGWVRLIATGQASPLGISPVSTLFAAGASAVAVGRRSRGAA
ncbi:S26 family signal peptidase [Haloparvum sp. PAK95]|uniref:S26 family signal peptidase n=1 Tax=Haloparvum sp. PAK95 TaxID=3418962 RepID=UPI003D2F0586